LLNCMELVDPPGSVSFAIGISPMKVYTDVLFNYIYIELIYSSNSFRS